VTNLSGRLQTEEAPVRSGRRAPATFWLGLTVCFAVIGGSSFFYINHESQAAIPTVPATLPQVVASRPLLQDLDSRLGFLGQFSAVDRVELRAQVGGTLMDIAFKDGEIVKKGDLLFVIDPRPYEIHLAEGNAALETAKARLVLANRQLYRSQALVRGDAGTVQDVDQRIAEVHASQAAVDNANAQIRDAQLDLEHSRITAPFTGRIGAHLVSVGNLIAGSRAATSPTTLLATIVSLDPIHLDFDMSEADYLTFSGYRAQETGGLNDKVELALGNQAEFSREGVLDFVDNALDRSSGTIHARATIPNTDLSLTPGEFARLRVSVAPPAPTLLVPDASVLPDQSQYIVLTVSPEGVVVPRQVKVGDIRGGLRVIRSGIGPNDRVITDGLAYATPGSKVTVQDGAIRFAAVQN
jgi:multidrug efflux system membrane fusion protein